MIPRLPIPANLAERIGSFLAPHRMEGTDILLESLSPDGVHVARVWHRKLGFASDYEKLAAETVNRVSWLAEQLPFVNSLNCRVTLILLSGARRQLRISFSQEDE